MPWHHPAMLMTLPMLFMRRDDEEEGRLAATRPANEPFIPAPTQSLAPGSRYAGNQRIMHHALY